MYLHNHIVHHTLTLWALGASPETIRRHQERNGQYQRTSMAIQSNIVEDLAMPRVFKRCLGREENYRNYERFFLKQINDLGYEAVLQKYLIGGDDIADDMLCRIYHGQPHHHDTAKNPLTPLRLRPRPHPHRPRSRIQTTACSRRRPRAISRPPRHVVP